MKNKYNYNKPAVELFGEWAIEGKDEGFEKNHFKPVMSMISFINQRYKNYNDLSFLDLGCGNGWVVREVLKNPIFNDGCGIDGAKEMIEKANKIDPLGNYKCLYIEDLDTSKTYDVIFSMEFIYYLRNPQQIIADIVEKNLNSNGIFIMGIDFYTENKQSHSWPSDLNIYMNLKNEDEWKKIFKNTLLTDIGCWTTGETLVVYGHKK